MSAAVMPLADELLLLAYDDASGKRDPWAQIDLGLAGAVLLELALAGRIDVVDGRVVVVDATPIGDEIADGALTRIASDSRQRKPKD